MTDLYVLARDIAQTLEARAGSFSVTIFDDETDVQVSAPDCEVEVSQAGIDLIEGIIRKALGEDARQSTTSSVGWGR